MTDFLKTLAISMLLFLVLWVSVEAIYQAVDTELDNRATAAQLARQWAADTGR